MLIKLEGLINSSINTLLRKQPEDPYGFLIGILQSKASNDVVIKSISAFESIGVDGLPTLKLKVKVTYLNKERSFIINEGFGILNESSVIYDSDRFNGKGL